MTVPSPAVPSPDFLFGRAEGARDQSLLCPSLPFSFGARPSARDHLSARQVCLSFIATRGFLSGGWAGKGGSDLPCSSYRPSPARGCLVLQLGLGSDGSIPHSCPRAPLLLQLLDISGTPLDPLGTLSGLGGRTGRGTCGPVYLSYPNLRTSLGLASARLQQFDPNMAKTQTPLLIAAVLLAVAVSGVAVRFLCSRHGHVRETYTSASLGLDWIG